MDNANTSITIGFSRPSSPYAVGSYAIRLWQGSTPYCHVYLKVYSSYTGEMLVYQASHGLVNCMNYENFLSKNVVVNEFVLSVDRDKLKNIVKVSQQLLGRPYGYAGLAVLLAAKLIGKWVPSSAKWGDGLATLHCSEFIGELMPELMSGANDDLLEPVDLYKALELKHAKQLV